MEWGFLPSILKYLSLPVTIEYFMVSVSDAELCKAAASGADKFLEVIVDGIRRAAGDCLNAEAIMILNGYQNALMAYSVFRDEVMEGGFIQLIQNGYGPYIFYNPFAKSMRLFGVARLAVLVNKANEIYRANRDDLERERDDDEFMAMYEQYEQFDPLQDEFIELEPDFTNTIAAYVDDNINQFVDEIVR